MLFTTSPVILKVFDPDLEYEPHRYIDTWRLYSWDGLQYRDVTQEYGEEILQELRRQVANTREQYGSRITFTRTDFLRLLFQADKAGVRDEAFELFIEVTDPVHWPGTEQTYFCWLQVIRDQAEREFAEGVPFSKPPSAFGLSMSEAFDWQTCQFAE